MADYAEFYGIRLLNRPGLSWAEFRDLTEGLLWSQSRLRAATHKTTEPEAVMPDWSTQSEH